MGSNFPSADEDSVFERCRSSLTTRFWKYADRSGQCWTWTGTKSQAYGALSASIPGERPRRIMAHRISWRLHHGDIPPRILVLHKCDNRICVNPDHLFLGNHRDNRQDCEQKGRALVGYSQKTTCRRGHPHTEENTYVTPDKHRQCRECARAYERARRARNKQ